MVGELLSCEGDGGVALGCEKLAERGWLVPSWERVWGGRGGGVGGR